MQPEGTGAIFPISASLVAKIYPISVTPRFLIWAKWPPVAAIPEVLTGPSHFEKGMRASLLEAQSTTLHDKRYLHLFWHEEAAYNQLKTRIFARPYFLGFEIQDGVSGHKISLVPRSRMNKAVQVPQEGSIACHPQSTAPMYTPVQLNDGVRCQR